MTKTDLNATEFDSYYGVYIEKVPVDRELRQGFQLGKEYVISFFKYLPEEKLNYAYQEGKWTVKEVFQHLIDTERIFMYRALRAARRDQTPLAGFDQNIYLEPSGANQKSREDLIQEFEATRNYSISLLNSLTDDDLANIGISSDKPMSARAASFTILGHDIWHIGIIKERYL